MKRLNGNLLYGQSGGPTAVINASAYGVISEAKKHPEIENIYCLQYGISGVFNNEFVDVTYEDDDTLKLLLNTPGAAFGSTRHKITKEEEYEEIYKFFLRNNIRYFFYNGGNDSMDTCNKIARYFKKVGYECNVIGIPKTIDNDLALTDHCPGFGSAAKYIANQVSEIVCDCKSYKKGRVTIIEIMGRNTGWLAASSSLACLSNNGPDLIYLPENPFIKDKFFKEVKEIYDKKGYCIVCVAEGIKDESGKYISDLGQVDAFGHAQMGGTALYLANELTNKGVKTRAIELNLSQRCASHLASKTDLNEAIAAGKFGVKQALQNKTNLMIGFERVNNKCVCKAFNLDEIANVEKFVSKSMINESLNHVTKEFTDYCLPLIQKEYRPKYKNGLLKFVDYKDR